MIKSLFVFFMKTGILLLAILLLWPTYVRAQEILRLQNGTLANSSSIEDLMILGEKWRKHNPDSALLIYHKILSVSKVHNYPQGLIQAALELGSLYSFKGQYPQALTFYNYALKNRPGTVDATKAYNGLASVYTLSGDCKEAVRNYHEALALAEKATVSGSKTLINIYHNLSIALHQCNEDEKALDYINKALLLSDSAGDRHALSKLMNAKGISLYFGKQQFREAIICLDSAIQLAKSVSDYTLIHPALVNKGTLMVRNNLTRQAIPLFLEAKALTEKSPINLNDKIGNISALGDAYLNLKKYKEAEASFKQAWQYADRLPKERHFLLYKLAELYEATGDYQKAFAYQKDFMGLSDSLHNKEVVMAVNTLEAKYQVLEKDKKITSNQLLISHQQEKIIRKNLWIVLTSCISIICALLLAGYYFYQQQRNNRLLSNQRIEQLQAKIEGEEEERKRLAQELHDGINSQLAGAKSYVLAMGNIFPELKEAPIFRKVNTTLNELSDNIRNVAQNLLPGELTNQQLTTTIDKFCQTLMQDAQIEIEFHAYGSFADLSPSLALNIYRITQELLHNIVKHAASREAIVLLNEHPLEISLIVEDNGKGIDWTTQKNGMGLNSVQARVNAQEGTIHIESETGKGTIVSIFFPKKISRKNQPEQLIT